MSSHIPIDIPHDPLNRLWTLCRRGTPLVALFNALEPNEMLSLEADCGLLSDCKKNVYHFIVACRNELSLKEDELFTLSDVYKDNTNGFVKVVNTMNMILSTLEDKGVIPCTKTINDSKNEPKDTRDKVVLELLETERKYVQDLEVLQNYMGELQVQAILSPDSIHYLFGNLNTLVDFQRRFLIQLEEMAEKPAVEQNFGSLFSLNEDSFIVYEPYCSNYFSAQDLVVQETPKLQKLADILNPVYELPSMLIKPIQRICKYPLLMQQMIKATDKDWPHVSEMELGLESIRRVTEKVNETQRKYENTQAVDEMKRRLDEYQSSQIDQFGTLLLHDTIWITQFDHTPEKEMHVYFFDRVLLLCKEYKNTANNTIYIKKKKRGSLQPKHMIVMQKIIKIKSNTTELVIDWKDKEVDHIILRFRNEENLKLWESALQKRMKPIRPNVSNTQLVSMKTTNLTEIPAFFRTEDDDDPRPHYLDSPLPRTSSHVAPISPPLSHPSSPRLEDYPYLYNRSQSQSVSQGQPFPYTRLRSQSSPNIQRNNTTSDIPCIINSRALYTLPPPSPLEAAPLKLKLNFNDGIYVIMCGHHIGYADLMDKVDKKIRLVANLQIDSILRLKYQDEDGDLITINSDEDVQMAFENHSHVINLFLSI